MPDIPAYKPDSPPTIKMDGAKSRSSSGRAKSSKLPPDRAFKATIPELKEALETAAGFAVLGFSARGDMHCAEVVMDGAPELIESWLWLAQKHPEVRRALEVLCGSGGYLALITSTLGVALPIMQHHGLYPQNAPTPRSLREVMGNMFTPTPQDADQSTSPEA